MRFRKRVKVFPGFTLNFSKSGISSTVGIKGASINFGKNGTYLNTGIPGTGFYDRHKIGGNHNPNHPQSTKNKPFIEETNSEIQTVKGEIKSSETSELISENFIELQNTLKEVFKDRIELAEEIEITRKAIESAKSIYLISCILLFGLIIKSFKNKVIEQEEYLLDLENQMNNSLVDIDVQFDSSFESNYQTFMKSYKNLLSCELIWDITSSLQQDTKVSRSAATNIVTRTTVNYKFEDISIVKSNYSAFHIENKNGGDLYIYPAFVIIISDKNNFGIIDIKDLDLIFSEQRFLEEGNITKDTKVIDKTWFKVNKDGTPDKRFAANYEIPIVRYGKIEFKSMSGLNEVYSFSSFEKAEEFALSFNNYKQSLLVMKN